MGRDATTGKAMAFVLTHSVALKRAGSNLLCFCYELAGMSYVLALLKRPVTDLATFKRCHADTIAVCHIYGENFMNIRATLLFYHQVSTEVNVNRMDRSNDRIQHFHLFAYAAIEVI